jgi:hypothetical protein
MPRYNFFRFGDGKSWHLLEQHDDTYTYARCGRKKEHPVEASETLPGNEKTCERCMVFATRDADRPKRT